MWLRVYFGLQRRCLQSGFILQPYLVGLEIEPRLYFSHGRCQMTILTERSVPSEEDGSNLLHIVEVRGHEPHCVRHHLYSTILPQLQEFAMHLLRVCEAHCSLVSRSGMLRVDLGVETLHGVDEDLLLRMQFRPQRWHKTGSGAIVRFFCNEVQ
jgi:hypothetical protein